MTLKNLLGISLDAIEPDKAHGFRTLTSKPGHHQTAIQTLGLTLGLPQPDIMVLDALRKQRNLADYSGDLIPESAVKACLDGAISLNAQVRTWLKHNHPEWL